MPFIPADSGYFVDIAGGQGLPDCSARATSAPAVGQTASLRWALVPMMLHGCRNTLGGGASPKPEERGHVLGERLRTVPGVGAQHGDGVATSEVQVATDEAEPAA